MKLKPRFGLRTLFVVIALICACLAWQMVRRGSRRAICEQIVRGQLTQIHWMALDSNSRMLSSTMVTEFGAQTAYVASFLLTDGKFNDGTSADDFEGALLAAWRNATPTAGPPAEETTDRGPFVF